MASGNKPTDGDKRAAMRYFAGQSARFAGRWVPGARIIRNLENFDPDVFEKLYNDGAQRKKSTQREYLDMHGRNFFRPPGALHEDEFLKTCEKCGKCAEACPEDIIHFAKENEGPPEGTPIIRPNHEPCIMCGDCMEACPTGALKPTPVSKMRIGIAVVDSESCIGYAGTECRDCHDACPLEPNAIAFDELKPMVDSRVCTGCGLCVEACPTRPPSIVVLPRPKRRRSHE